MVLKLCVCVWMCSGRSKIVYTHYTYHLLKVLSSFSYVTDTCDSRHFLYMKLIPIYIYTHTCDGCKYYPLPFSHKAIVTIDFYFYIEYSIFFLYTHIFFSSAITGWVRIIRYFSRNINEVVVFYSTLFQIL